MTPHGLSQPVLPGAGWSLSFEQQSPFSIKPADSIKQSEPAGNHASTSKAAVNVLSNRTMNRLRRRKALFNPIDWLTPVVLLPDSARLREDFGEGTAFQIQDLSKRSA